MLQWPYYIPDKGSLSEEKRFAAAMGGATAVPRLFLRGVKTPLKHEDPIFCLPGRRVKGTSRNHGVCRILLFMWCWPPSFLVCGALSGLRDGGSLGSEFGSSSFRMLSWCHGILR